jgi:hypothetical protein
VTSVGLGFAYPPSGYRALFDINSRLRSQSIANARALSSVASSAVKHILAAVIGSAVDVAVDIEHPIDEARAENGAEEEISPKHIQTNGKPIVHGWVCRENHTGSHGQEKQETGHESSCYAIDITDIFDHD